MLAWIMSPRGSVATAAAVSVVVAGVWAVPHFMTRGQGGGPEIGGQQAPVPPAPQTASVAPSTGAAPVPASSMPPAQEAVALAPASPPPVPVERGDVVPLAAPKQAAKEPAFDIVRVEPSGDAVVAGRATPGSKVALLDRGTVVTTVTADAGGQFAILPPTLDQGAHFLTLQTEAGGKTALSQQSVAVSVNPDRTSRPMVALMTPDQPAQVLSGGAGQIAPSPTAGPAAVAPAAAPAATVAIQSVETGGNGALTATGVANAGSQCRLYLNGAYLADVKAGKDGRWSVKVEKGMKPGRYTVRADQLAANSGKVMSRAEVPFDFPSGRGTARRQLMAKTVQAAPAQPLQMAARSGSPAAASTPATPQAHPPLPAETHAAVASAIPQGPAAPAPTPALTPDAQVAAAAPPAEADAAAAAIVKELQTATVIRGDSLWRISRKMLGHGVQYTEIYASNASQIRDPSLIYPGQIFVVPNRAVQ